MPLQGHELVSLVPIAIGVALGVIGFACLLVLVDLAQRRGLRVFRSLGYRVRAMIDRLRGEVPWLDRDATVLSGQHGVHQTAFVSRHHLAEGGLECPLCQERVVAGDFSRVFRTLIDGRENEVIVCAGKRIVHDGREVPCNTLLIASPDTEHGDHLNDDGTVDATGANDPPEFYHFVRAPADQALREKWGVATAVGQTMTGDEIVDVPNDRPATESAAPAAPAKDTTP